MTTATVLHLTPPAPAKGPTPKRKRKPSRRGFGNVRKLPSGRHQARYVGPDGVSRTAPVTFETKGDADKWLAKEQTRITDQSWRPPTQKTTLTFRAAAEGYLAKGGAKGQGLTPKTEHEYRRWLDRLVYPTLGDRLVHQVSAELIQAWYDELCPDRPVQRARVYSLVASILGTVVPVNPCQIEGAGSAKTKRDIEPATLEELEALLDSVPAHYRAAIVLAGWTALRFGEITELRRSDVDLKRGVVKIRRGVTWTPEVLGSVGGTWVSRVGDPKSEAGKRAIPFPPHILPVLQRHLQEFTQEGQDGLLYSSQDGGHLRYVTLWNVFDRARAKAGRPDLRPHDLRHTSAVMAAQAGATLLELMERLGHGSQAMALRYQHVAAGRQAELSRRMSEMATGGGR